MKPLVSFAACVAFLAAQAAPAYACAEAWESEGPPPVAIQHEDVLVAWDAGVEHLVRRISFGEAKDDFGFLVPLPSVPDLAEADPAVFARLEEITKPVKIYAPGSFWLTGVIFDILSPFIMGASMGIDDEDGSVRVLGVAKVAGQVATTLQADDAKALARWLKANGYRARPDLSDWLERYVRDKWTIVAFKYDPARRGARLDAQAVRLSFKTQTPFFPYREPADQRESAGGPRLLRLFYIGPERVQGEVGAGAWAGSEIYARREKNAARLLAGAVPSSFSPSRSWLIVSEDRSSPRPGLDELYLRKGGSSLPRIPYEIVWLRVFPLEFVFLVLLLAAPLIIRWRRRRERMAREGQKR